MIFSVLRSQYRTFVAAHPLTKGMIAYSVLWPTGSLIQQTIEGRNFESYDWIRCLRFSLYGGLYVAPSLYCWVRLTTLMWPKTSLKIGLIKAAVEQFSYGPFALASFYIAMSLLEANTLRQSVDEMMSKFLPTFKVGICFWPIVQTFNFSIVPERNRVLVVSLCSILWTTFLAYMKQIDKNELDIVYSNQLKAISFDLAKFE